MGRYYKTKTDCEMCGEEFLTTRKDASCCSGRCRTAKHRRDKARKHAEQQIMDSPYRDNYLDIRDLQWLLGEELKDIWGETDDAGFAIVLNFAHKVKQNMARDYRAKLDHKQWCIDTLQQKVNKLDQIRAIIG